MQTQIYGDHSRSITASTSLVRRVKSQDQDAWRRLVRIYGPLVYRWARKTGLQAADAEDIVGEVFADLVRDVGRFQKDGEPHSFRRWLHTITSRKLLKHLHKASSRPAPRGGTTAHFGLQGVAAQADAGENPEMQEEIDWVRQHAMKILQGDHKPEHWQVFRRVVLEGHTPAEVAKAIGMTVWAVYKVRSRVLHRLRTELDEFL